MAIQDKLYQHDIATLKEYGTRYKLTLHKLMRTSGIEINNKYTEKCSVNDEKLDVNISRAKAKLFEYADCNPWDMFLTITLDSHKYDRHDLEKFNKDLNNFINNYNKKFKLKIKRIFIPEEHKKGGWHMHGLIYGLPIEHLRPFTLDEKLPAYIREKLKKGEKVFEWVAYREKFGFNDFEEIKNKEACYKYITKYISKDLGTSIKELNAHLYYASKGLKTALELKRGTLSTNSIPFDYENDYIFVKWYNKTAENLDIVRKFFQ